MPANGETVTIPTAPSFSVCVDKALLAETHAEHGQDPVLHGALLVKDGGGGQQKAQLLSIQSVRRGY